MTFVDLGKRNKGTFWGYMAAYAFSRTRLPNTDFKITNLAEIGKGDANNHCHSLSDISSNIEVFKTEFSKGVYTLKFFDELIHVYTDPYETLVQQLAKKDLVHLTNEELARLCTDVFNVIGTTHTPMLFALYTRYLDDFIHQSIIDIVGDDLSSVEVNQIKNLLLTPQHIGLPDKESDAIHEIAVSFTKDTDQDFENFFSSHQELFQNLVNQYGWFHMEYAQQPFSVSDYKNLVQIAVQSIDKYIPFMERKNKLIKEQEEFFKNYQGTKNDTLQKLSYFMQQCARILDHSKEITVRGHFMSTPLFLEIAQRLHVSRLDLLMLTLPEIVDYLQTHTPADQTLIDKRKTCRVTLLKDGEISVYEGSLAEEQARILFPDSVLDSKTIKGVVAFEGSYTGTVKVINSINDKKNFNPGDVLVSHDGSAELTLLLRQAGAIITDGGGIISHVATVAREMKIPTIVATGNATQVLTNGMVVEVDAVNGVVIIIK